MKTSAWRILALVVGAVLASAPPEGAIRRLNSAGREILVLAERLAASGNRSRAESVHANLHRYVAFIQSKLPRGGPGNSRSPGP